MESSPQNTDNMRLQNQEYCSKAWENQEMKSIKPISDKPERVVRLQRRCTRLSDGKCYYFVLIIPHDVSRTLRWGCGDKVRIIKDFKNRRIIIQKHRRKIEA